MNIPSEFAKSFGLTANESHAYLCALGRAGVVPAELARDVDIPRPTAYHVLETLVQKGLLSKTRTTRGFSFVATPPARLTSLLRREHDELGARERLLEALLPSLEKEQRASDVRLGETVRYDGLTGIKLLFEEALYCKGRAWDVIAPSKNVLRDIDKKYAEYVYATQRDRDIKLRTLWENKQHDTAHAPAEIIRRNIRLMPPAMTGRFASLIIVFDDAVAVFPPLKEKSATLIRSQEVAAAFSAIFDGLWELGTPYRK